MSAGAAPGGDRPGDGSAGGSRPSKNNRQAGSQGVQPPEFLEPGDLPGNTGLRPVSVEERTLREEATIELSESVRARQWYRVLNEWRDWMHDYRSMHIEYDGPDGETVRTRLENSYQPRYGKRYYAKLKDLERGISGRYSDLVTVMLTFSASHLNADGLPRCPADHMREIADGWGTARKQVHQALSGMNWEYARVWEPHPGGERSPGGYGHMHVALFVEADDLDAERFRPVMESYVHNTRPAGSEAHGLDKVGLGDAVSVNDDVENLGSYISEYIGIFGDEALNRPVTEQMFYATTWATQTRRLDFSNGAQELIVGEQFRRETGLRPCDRGEALERNDGAASECEGGSQWSVRSICTVRSNEPNYADPTAGGARTRRIEGRPGMDPPRRVG